jgi:hypothetical protein
MAEFSGFSEMEEFLGDMSERFDAMADRHGEENAREAIERGFHNIVDEIVRSATTRYARGGYKQTGTTPGPHDPIPVGNGDVDYRPLGWSGNRLNYRIRPMDDILKWHEFGTSRHTIRPDTEPYLQFQWEHPPIGAQNALGIEPGQWVRMFRVTHPGVEAKGYISQELDNNEQELTGAPGGEIMDVVEENMDDIM